MIKVGETAILKCSNEEVFILELKKGAIRQVSPTAVEVGPEVAIVRRPTGTQDGVKHLTEEFYVMELETKEDRLERELSERNMLRKKMGLDGDVALADIPNEQERPN